MEDTETKSCPNCKREIPCVNFTIHSVHCARNIRMCPVCKEPVLHNELQEHHDKLHKLLPCKKCGESVCGTDLEDHIRDSCAQTIKSCRFCELEVPRRELPAHENYCGVRTEQCPDCSEWVMIKYRQLHIDSNHGFIRLDDDPTPVPKKEPPKSSTSKPLIAKLTNIPSTGNGPLQATSKIESRTNGYVKNINQASKPDLRYFDEPSTSSVPSTSSNDGSTNGWKTSNPINGIKAPVKRTNDQPQINTSVATANKVDKNLGISRGAVKKRLAPKPPTQPSTSEPLRDLPYYSALQRQQREEKARQEQTAYNLSVGLPPVLSPAAKLDKLRKMDALQNPESHVDYKDKLQGRVWKSPDNEARDARCILSYEPPIQPSTSEPLRDLPYYSALQRQQREDKARQEQTAYNLSVGLPPVLSPAAKLDKLRKMDALQNPESHVDYKDKLQGRVWKGPDNEASGASCVLNYENEKTKQEFKNLKPMTPAEFMQRFNELQLRNDGELNRRKSADRFSEIKSSLRELRRGLNEVTAPYNTPSNNNGERANPPPPQDDDRLPCEFCDTLIPSADLVQHQTGCRPDLTQFRPGAVSPVNQVRSASRIAPPPRASRQDSYEDPVIPCEFCFESLPVYLISEHQERCGRESNLLYAD